MEQGITKMDNQAKRNSMVPDVFSKVFKPTRHVACASGLFYPAFVSSSLISTQSPFSSLFAIVFLLGC
jgi:hypothetical protein